MKKILLLVFLISLTLPVWAASPDLIIDQIAWYTPLGPSVPARAGVIAAGSSATDFVDGQAICNTNYPFPPPFFFIVIGGGIEVSNNAPACGNVNYYIFGNAFSARSDGNYDHLREEGSSWYPNQPGRPPNLPNVVEWNEACSQVGTDLYGNSTGILGGPYIVTHNPGLCWGP